MANRLSVIFNAVDNISSRLSAIASIGENVTTGFQRVEDAANRALSAAQSGASNAANALGQASSAADSLANAMNGCNQNLDRTVQNSEDVANAGDLTRNSLSDMERAANRAGDELGDLSDQADRAGDHAEDFGERSESAIFGLGSAIAAAGIAKSLQEIGMAMFDCAQKGEAFETAIAQLQTISGGDSIGKLQADIVALSNKTGQASEGLADTAYNAISAGTAVADSVNMAATASELAVAGFTDTSSALSVLTTAINSYGDAAGSAEHIADSLVTVQNLGVTTVAQLAQQMGKAISTASAYNVSLENLESGYISVTKAGINAAEGTTYLASMFNELGNAGSAISKLVQDETGKTFGQLMSDGQSVADVLGLVYDKCNQNAEAMMNLWGSAEAGKAANAIISQGLGTFNDNLETLRTGVGVTADAYAIMADTTAYAHNKMDNAAKNLQTTIGRQLNPTLEKLYDLGADVFSGIGGFLEEYPEVTRAVTAIVTGLGTVVAGVTAVTFASKVAIPALKTFGVAVSEAMGPIGWVSLALTAVVAAGTAFSAMMSETNAEIAGMTSTTQAQYYELQELNSEYENACEKYGETDEKTLRLKYDVDELSTSYELNRQSLESFSAEIDAAVESHNKLISSYQDNMSGIKDNELGTLALIQKLEDLASQTDITAGSEEQMHTIINQLNEDMPDLALSYDDVTKSAEGSMEAMKKMVKEQAEQERQEERLRAWVELMKDQVELENDVADAEAKLNAERRLNGVYFNQDYGMWMNDSGSEDGFMMRLTTDIDVYKEKLSEAEAALEDNKAAIAAIENEYGNVAEAAEEASNVRVSGEEAAAQAYQIVQGEIEALCVAYDEAYNSALSSVEGQYSLWDKVGKIASTSMWDLTAALDSQTQYWENYANNLETLYGKAGQIDGLKDLLKQMDDGSEESASALAAMANASDEQLGKMVEKHRGLQEAQARTAGGMDDLQNDFNSDLDEMAQKMQDTVDGMDMEESAKTAAENTMQGYISAIQTKGNEAVTAAQNIANAVSRALNSASSAASSAAATQKTSGVPAEWTFDGNASGTMNSGKVYIAGEEGPELIVSGGGDKVFPTGETDRIIAAVSGKLDNPQMTDSMSAGFAIKGMEGAGDVSAASEKTLTIKLEGSGTVSVGRGASTENLWDSVKDNFKQAFMSMLQEEMYEEGAGAYEF